MRAAVPNDAQYGGQHLPRPLAEASGGPLPSRRGGKAFLIGALALLVVAIGSLYGAVLLGMAPGGAPEIQNVAADLNRAGATGEVKDNFRSLLGLSLIGLPLVLPLLWLVWLHNGIVDKEEQVYAAWAQVESGYQRRNDLIPGLVRAVTRYLQHERESLVEVTGERTGALGPIAAALEEIEAAQAQAEEVARATGTELEAQAVLERLAAAQQGVDRSLGRFFGVVESYPQLRSADQFLELQAQLEGTENRINVARVQFNERVEAFNSAIRRLPGSLVAGFGGFRRKAYFQAEEGAAEAAELGF
jgi:LemA protein